ESERDHALAEDRQRRDRPHRGGPGRLPLVALLPPGGPPELAAPHHAGVIRQVVYRVYREALGAALEERADASDRVPQEHGAVLRARGQRLAVRRKRYGADGRLVVHGGRLGTVVFEQQRRRTFIVGGQASAVVDRAPRNF